jgi:starvation-inducible DNA-binding protein
LINQSISQIEKNPVNLPEHYAKQIVDLLNTDLASHFILFFQFKKQHWIVEGPDWKHISTALDEYAKTIQGLAELLAEIKPTRSYTIIKSITIQKIVLCSIRRRR